MTVASGFSGLAYLSLNSGSFFKFIMAWRRGLLCISKDPKRRKSTIECKNNPSRERYQVAMQCQIMLSNPPGTRGSRPVEMAASVHSTVRKFNQCGTCFHDADIHAFGRRLHNLMSVNEDPIASQHQSRTISSHLLLKIS